MTNAHNKDERKKINEKPINGELWGVSSNLSKLLCAIDDGFRRPGDIEEIEELLDTYVRHVCSAVVKLKKQEAANEDGSC